MTKLNDIAAPIPPELVEADDVLFRFGRWSMSRRPVRRCGSAEGKYRSPPNDDDRLPRELMMPAFQAMEVSRSLAQVPKRFYEVLKILYVPRHTSAGMLIKPEVQLRIMRIPPKLSQERHLEGLVHFRNIHRLAIKESAVIMRAPDNASETTSSPMAGSRVSARCLEMAP